MGSKNLCWTHHKDHETALTVIARTLTVSKIAHDAIEREGFHQTRSAVRGYSEKLRSAI